MNCCNDQTENWRDQLAREQGRNPERSQTVVKRGEAGRGDGLKIICDRIVRKKGRIDEAEHPENVLTHVVGNDIIRSECLAQSETRADRGVEHGKGKPGTRLSAGRIPIRESKESPPAREEQTKKLRHERARRNYRNSERGISIQERQVQS